MSSSIKTVGFIGTGLMGLPMAKNILSKKFKLNVWNRTPGKTLELKKKGAKIFKDIKVSVGYTPDHVIHEQFSQYKKSLETRFSKIIKKKLHIAPELLEEIFEDALTFKASDIHFEPQKEKVVIRFRIDGVLQEAGILPKEYYENILNRIKIKIAMITYFHFDI